MPSAAGVTLRRAALLAVILASGCLAGNPSPPTPTFMPSPSSVWIHHFGQSPASVPDGPIVAPTFALRTINRTTGWEPTLAITKSGAILLPSLTRPLPDTFSYATHVELRRSTDDGQTWRRLEPTILGQPLPPAISSDPYLFADPVTGRVYVSELRVDCTTLAWSDDEGTTWDGNPFACANVVQDHQTLWMAPGAPLGPGGRWLHMCSNYGLETHCERSADGGRTFTQAGFPFADARGTTSCGGSTGHGVTVPSTATVLLGRAGCGTARVARSTDQMVTWTSVALSPPADPRLHDVNLAVDATGNAYAVYIDAEHRPRLSISRDDGRSWSPAEDVSPPGVHAASHPTVVAGAEGRIALFYMASWTPSAPSTQWHYVATTLRDALATDPLLITVDTSGRALVAGASPGGANLGGAGDFFDAGLLPDGRMVATLVDVCQGPCPASQAAPAPAGPVGMVIQTAGERLR